jgi:hypothetical protein
LARKLHVLIGMQTTITTLAVAALAATLTSVTFA